MNKLSIEMNKPSTLWQVQDGEEEVRKARGEARESAREAARLEKQNAGWEAGAPLPQLLNS